MSPMCALVAAAVYVASPQNSRGQSEAESRDRTSSVVTTITEARRVSFYPVPLVCPAAPHIGCGSAAKPILLDLEATSGVSQAWLNRAGSILAVVWSEKTTPRMRSRILKTALKKRQMATKELAGDPKQQALTDFQSGNGWYRGADVDRLSEEEAGVIAERVLRRIRENITVSDAKAKVLQDEFTGVLKRQLTGQIARSEAQDAMLNFAREHLDEKDVEILLDAFQSRLRPQTNEK